jgi:predicted nucleic acid-binding protein
MKPLLLGTNVLIRFFRCDRKIADIISTFEKIVIPTVVLGEFKSGVDPLTVAGKRQLEVLDAFLDSPSVDIIPVTEDVSSAYARIFRTLKANGTPIPQNDIWIAACAMDTGATLISSDSHFARIPLLDIRIIE